MIMLRETHEREVERLCRRMESQQVMYRELLGWYRRALEEAKAMGNPTNTSPIPWQPVAPTGSHARTSI